MRKSTGEPVVVERERRRGKTSAEIGSVAGKHVRLFHDE